MGIDTVGIGTVFFQLCEVLNDLLKYFLIHRVLGGISSLGKGRGRGGGREEGSVIGGVKRVLQGVSREHQRTFQRVSLEYVREGVFEGIYNTWRLVSGLSGNSNRKSLP